MAEGIEYFKQSITGEPNQDKGSIRADAMFPPLFKSQFHSVWLGGFYNVVTVADLNLKSSGVGAMLPINTYRIPGVQVQAENDSHYVLINTERIDLTQKIYLGVLYGKAGAATKKIIWTIKFKAGFLNNLDSMLAPTVTAGVPAVDTTITLPEVVNNAANPSLQLAIPGATAATGWIAANTFSGCPVIPVELIADGLDGETGTNITAFGIVTWAVPKIF
jgi:hypothetical protein